MQQVIFSEDFSGGLATGTAFSTDYSLAAAGSSTGASQYRVVNNPGTAFANGFTSYFDHTVGTSAGAMLFFDGSGSGSAQRVFYRTATLTAGTQYTFSFWGSSGFNASVPTLNILIDGLTVGGPDLTTTNGTWSQFTANYTPTTGGLHTFAIYDTNTQGFGNDGALDDVRLIGPASAAPEPGSLSLLGMGLASGAGMIGMVKRRKAKGKAGLPA